MTAEFTDNINLAEEGRRSDISLGPEVGIGLFYPVNHRNLFSLDLGVGYRWYWEHDQLSTFQVSPNTHVDYRFWVKDVQINLHDDFHVQADPASRPELSGSAFNCRRFINNSGIEATGQPWESLTWTLGYDFSLDRTLNREFRALDRNAHTFHAGTQHEISPRWTAGLYAAYTLNEYVQKVQNDSAAWSVGPTLVFKASEFLTLDGSLFFTRQDFERSGTVADTSDFEGLTFQGGLRHTLNRRMSHGIRARRSIELGLASNYTEMHAVQ